MNAPDPPHLSLVSHFVVFCVVWVLLGLFRRLMKHDSKWAELVQSVQKIVPRSRVGIFHKKRTRSTPLDPKLMFWCVSYCLGAFGTVSSPSETWFKMGRTGAINAKVHATKLC